MQVTAESCTQIRINDLQRKIRALIKRDYPEASEEEVYNYMYEELKKFTTNKQSFEYVALKNHLGGHRWFFTCPKCGKRVNKLLLPPTWTNKEQMYYCKACHGLKNQSVVMGQSSLYQKVIKPLKRMKEIEKKISVGHMTMDRVQQLLNEYDNIEAALKASPEYRLYIFKKKHGLMPGESKAIADARNGQIPTKETAEIAENPE